MIIRNEQDLEGLRKIGRIVALAREEMKKTSEARYDNERA